MSSVHAEVNKMPRLIVIGGGWLDVSPPPRDVRKSL